MLLPSIILYEYYILNKNYFQYINKTNTLNQVRLKVFDDFIRLI